MKKVKSISIKDYFLIKNPEYVYLKLITTSSVRNYRAVDLAKIINDTYVKVENRFKKQNKGFEYIAPNKVSFIVDITKNSSEFFIIVPKLHLRAFKQKLTEVFGKITIEEVKNIRPINKDCLKYSLSYAKDDSLSLAVDKRDNDLLSSNMSIMDVLHDDERVTIIYNFVPQNKFKLNNWKNYHKTMMEKYYNGECLDKDLTFMKIMKVIGCFLCNAIDTITESLQESFGDKKTSNNEKGIYSRIVPVQELSKTSIKKEKATIIDTQIILCSQAEDKFKEEENMNTLISTFSVIDEDNKLIPKKISNKKFKVNKENNSIDLEVSEFNVNKNKLSCEEIGSNITVLPGRELIQEYKIQAVQHNETTIPEELTGDGVRFGYNTFRGQTTKVTTSDNEDASCMPLVIMGKMGGGKSTLFENMGVDTIKNDEGLVMIDFIKNCETSDNIIRNIQEDKSVVIDFADYMCKEGFGFNEIEEMRDMNNPMSRYECASLQSAQYTNFIDSLNKNEDFSASMGRFFDAACSCVLIHENKCLKDVIKCLECFKTRYEFLKLFEEFKLEMPEEYQELIQDDINALYELDETTKVGSGNKATYEVSGTKLSKIEGILSRVSLLRKTPSLKFMYARSTKNNINLCDLMQQGKAIFFKLPQSKFSSPIAKNVMVSYLMSKIMIASEVRAVKYKDEKLKIVNVICDELQQAPGSYSNVEYMAYQMRKFRVRLSFSCHGFHKIAPIKDTLVEAGASIMLLKGSSVKNFEYMEDEFKKFGFEKNDLVALSNTEEYKALCLIACKKGRHGCLVKLPDPVKNKIEMSNVIEVDFNKAS